MKKFLKKYWLAILAVLLTVGIITLLLTRGGKPTPSPTPEPVPFELSNAYPQEGSYEVVIPNLAIEFLFTKEVDLAKTAVDISPTSNIDISYGDTKKAVVVNPQNEWLMDTVYTFTIRAESKNGEKLSDPYEYEIEFTELQQSDLQETY